MSDSNEIALCSECFRDQGLRLDARRIGVDASVPCPQCGSTSGRQLDVQNLARLAYLFFVWGTLHKGEYGAAPVIQFNEYQTTSIAVPHWLEEDIHLIERTLKVGFFHYGPRMWMVGEVEPLKALIDPVSRSSLIERLVGVYPTSTLTKGDVFYRIRKEPPSPASPNQYDSPPVAQAGRGRLDSPNFPVMYASPHLSICVHECRVSAEDEMYVATLTPTGPLRLLDLSVLLTCEGDTDEHESLDIAVHMLFLAGSHSYDISRALCLAAHTAGFDGIVYPSYFSLLRIGAMPFETVYGISRRRIQQLQRSEQAKVSRNLGIFGRPIADGRVQVRCINRLILHRVQYGIHFGPVGVT